MADEQLVQVCLTTADGSAEWPGWEIAYALARGPECDHPAILTAYDAVAAFAAASGRELGGPPRETYITDPGSSDPQMGVAFPLLPPNSRGGPERTG